ncbi:hypothetical protein U8326_02190 [Tsuneonella sp. CC-YZS046]|uniref:hypothetical protein n=1 Tax=Tsuneonella sp. CC-YZS046 TaxID=3042152 RepID=UPI002D76EF06|nr:hypothetical protein [Tsuneonella sp. CC-YZS046]WRO67003.1 hypothetical protein U8326_02190 [Tsuneonella sp. CC-YZS046]
MLPLVARRELGLDAAGYGALLGCMGAGAVMFLAGLAWIGMLTSLNVAAQIASPGWVKAPAIIAVKRKGEYHPEIGGMTLNTALEYAANPDLPASTKPCILVNWRGSEVRIEGRHYLPNDKLVFDQPVSNRRKAWRTHSRYTRTRRASSEPASSIIPR